MHPRKAKSTLVLHLAINLEAFTPQPSMIIAVIEVAAAYRQSKWVNRMEIDH